MYAFFVKIVINLIREIQNSILKYKINILYKLYICKNLLYILVFLKISLCHITL